MIKGAVLIPDEELLARHGRDAEGQADRHALLDRRPRRDGLPQAEGEGYNVAFVYADVDVKKNGDFTVTPN